MPSDSSITLTALKKAMFTGFVATLCFTISNIQTVQELLGHKDVQTTMIYTHVLNRGGRGVKSLLDR
jgi:integrase